MMFETLMQSAESVAFGPLVLLAGSLLKSSALLLVAAALTHVLVRLSAAERHMIWTVAIVAALALPALTVVTPKVEVPVLWVSGLAPATQGHVPLPDPQLSTPAVPVPVAPRAVARNGDVRIAPTPIAPRAAARGGDMGIAPVVARGYSRGNDVEPALAPAARPLLPAVEPDFANAVEMPTTMWPQPTWTSLTRWAGLGVGVAWASGAALVLLSLLVGVLRLRQLERSAQPLANERLLVAARRVARRLGVQRLPRILVGDEHAIPMTWGAYRPRLLLPSVAIRWSDARLDAVLIHEFAHVKRRDYLTQMVAQVACALYWCNPLVWFAAHRLRVEREHACDDLVVSAGTEPTRYADTLLSFARSFHPASNEHATALAMARPNHLRTRLIAVLDQARSRRPARAARVLTAALVALPLVMATAAVAPVAADDSSDEPVLLAAAGETATEPAAHREAASAPIGSDHGPEELRAPTRASARGTGAFGTHPSGLHEPLPDHPESGARSGGFTGTEGSSKDATVPFYGLGTISGGALLMNAGDEGLAPTRIEASGMSVAQEATFLCGPADGKHQRSAHQTNNDHITIDHHYGDCRSVVEIRGNIDFNSDFTRIARLDRRAYLSIDVRRPGTRHELNVEAGAGGAPEYQWRVNGDEVAFDERAQAWLDDAIEELLRSTSYKARERAAWIMDERGVEGLVDELAFLRGDHLQGHYLAVALEDRDLSQAELQTVLGAAGRHLESDHQLGKVLVATAEKYRLGEAARREFLQAATSIESDHQQSTVFAAALRWDDLSGAEIQQLLETAAASIESDHNMGEILRGLTERYTVSSALRPHFLRAAATIDSDHQKGMVYGALLKSGDLSSAELADVLDAATGIESDHQLGELLQMVAQQGLSDPTLRAAFLDAARSIESDHQLGGVLMTALQADDLSDAEKTDIIEAAGSIGSDHTLSSVLIRSARTGLRGAGSQQVYLETASTLGDHSLQNALQAFMEEADAAETEQLLLLRTARRIGSDHSLGQVLRQFLDTYPAEGEVQVEFERALDSISSDHERENVARRLERARR